ncbi:MAG: hypothetical protein ACRDSE_04860 [Pseudonocardiaceae bacterium]
MSAYAARARQLLVVHIASSVGVLGADLVLLALGVTGWLGATPATVYPAMRIVAAGVIAPLAVVALTSGLALAMRARLVRRGWVLVKLGVTSALTVAVFAVVAPGLGRVAEDVTRTAGTVADSHRLTYAIAPSVSLALLLLNVVLAVYQPRSRGGART